MKPNLRLWILRDYKIPRSEGAQHITILILTVLTAALLVGELMFDLRATNIELISSLFVTNSLLLLFSFQKKFLKEIGVAQVIVLYLLFESHYVFLPESFHVITYWMPSVAVIALIFNGLRSAHIWIGIVILTLFFNSLFGIYSMGKGYDTVIHFSSTLIGGTVFTLTIISCCSVLYNLLGRAYFKLKIKNDEVTRLMGKLQEMNETLESKVIERTKNIEEQNRKLKEYAFMNSHLVRAPLANILGAVQHLDQTNSTDQIDQMTAIIRISAIDLDKVIKEVGKSLGSIEDSN